MAELLHAQQRLADRLRELRTQSLGSSVTQAHLAAALGTSVPLVSSWENANAVPPEERLKTYALLFAAPSALRAGRIPDETDLSAAEEHARRQLIDELISLREEAVRPARPVGRPAGALGGRFWHFPDGAPIRIITTKMWPSVLDKIPYADSRHPNYIQSYADADRDATIELFGHIRAENPTADVRFLTADEVRQSHLTAGHVIVLGQGDSLLVGERTWAAEQNPAVMTYLNHRLELPLGTRLPAGGDVDFDSEFVVTLDERGEPAWFPPGQEAARLVSYRPRFVRGVDQPGKPRRIEDGVPVLEYDVALLARRPNQLNLAATVTICAGVFSRGTFGAVRTLTDANLRSRNENFLVDHFGGLDDFWLLFYVPVFPGVNGFDTVTPDLERPFHRLHSSRVSQPT